MIALIAGVQAQTVVLAQPKSNVWISRSSITSTPVGQDAENIYFFMNDHSVQGFKPKKFTDDLYIVNKKSFQKSNVSIEVSNMQQLLGAICGGDGVIALYEDLQGKGDKIEFSIVNIDKNGGADMRSGEDAVVMTANPKYWPEFKTAKSPDGKLLAALAMVTVKDSQLENLFAVVVNNKGEFVWSGPVAPEFNYKTFYLGDIAVDNKGVLYVPVYTCTVKGKDVSDVQVLMCVATEEGSTSVMEDVTFGTPQNFTTKALSNGDIAVAGYYTDSKTTTSTKSSGYYFYRFDSESKSIVDLRNFAFSEGYVERNAWARFAQVLGNQQYSISADGIFELEDGTLVLCGEHRFIKSIRDMQTNSTTYQLLTKNILVSKLLPDGTSNFTMIEKQQSSPQGFIPKGDWRPAGISYTAFPHHNDMYFLFTDDEKNIPYPGNEVLCTLGGFSFSKTHTNVLMRLTPDQQISQRVISDERQLLRYVEFFDDTHFYASGLGKKELLLNKYAIEK